MIIERRKWRKWRWCSKIKRRNETEVRQWYFDTISQEAIFIITNQIKKDCIDIYRQLLICFTSFSYVTALVYWSLFLLLLHLAYWCCCCVFFFSLFWEEKNKREHLAIVCRTPTPFIITHWFGNLLDETWKFVRVRVYDGTLFEALSLHCRLNVVITKTMNFFFKSKPRARVIIARIQIIITIRYRVWRSVERAYF